MPASKSPSVPNPLREQNPALVRRFLGYRDRSAEWCQWWRASCPDDADSPEEPFESRLRELQAVTNVFDLLTEPEWNRSRLEELRRLMPVAMRVDEFRVWIDEAEQQIRLAMQRAESGLEGSHLETPRDDTVAKMIPGEGEDSLGKSYRGRRTEKGTVVEIIEPGKPPRPLNPRFDLRRHSMTGFEWGFSGSGPAQLALALAADVLGDDERAREIYQELKFKRIARLDGEQWRLTEAELRDQIGELETLRGKRRG